MWENILKKPITVGRTKIGMKPMPENDDDGCNKQLKAYADKLKSKQMYLKDGYNSKYMDPWREQFEINKDTQTAFVLNQLNTYVSWGEQFYESNFSHYSPIPEKVACKALEILKNEQSKDNDFDFEWTKEKIDGFEITIKFSYNYAFTVLQLLIYKGEEQKPLVNIGCMVGEDTSTFPEDVPYIAEGSSKEDNLFYAIGYYDARKHLDWR
jgi:hypothetical protein